MISINREIIAECAEQLNQLAAESVTVSECIVESRGKAATVEKEIIELLGKVCSNDLPLLFTKTSQLLTAMSESFAATDQAVKSSLESR